DVASNDRNNESHIYSLQQAPQTGNLTLNTDGKFDLQFGDYQCLTDSFVYEVCNPITGCCATATCRIEIIDNTPPLLTGIPEDITLDCQDEIPVAANIIAIDECPGIIVDLVEQTNEGACETFITRTWTSTDLCGNTVSDSQTIVIQDITPPTLYKIHTLPNGKKMVAGIAENVNHLWKTIRLPISFTTTPVVLTQRISNSENNPTTTQIKELNTQQFKLRLQEEEGEDNIHARERIAWVAIETGIVSDNYDLVAAAFANIDHNWQDINFPNSFDNLPAFFIQPQTTNEVDPVSVRTRNLSTTSVSVFLEEETSADSEQNHLSESLSYLAIDATSRLGQITDEKGIIVGEVGRAQTTNSWLSISYTQTYNNPIVIVGGITYNGAHPSVLEVRNVGNTNFEVRVSEWNYLDGNHTTENFSYLVIEGSLPHEMQNNCLDPLAVIELERELVAHDNCNGSLPIEYAEDIIWSNMQRSIQRTYTAVDICGGLVRLQTTDDCPTVAVRLRAYLQGAFMDNMQSDFMHDDLRTLDYLPLQEPYSTYPDFTHFGSGGKETIKEELLMTTGMDAIVDWVFVELKSANFPDSLIATRAALLQRDGDVVDVTGDTTLLFLELPPEDYFVSIRHRNHLGVGTAEPVIFNNNVPRIDFTLPETEVSGGENIRKIEEDKAMLWAGEINGDQKIIYQGPQNDNFNIGYTVLISENNYDFLANYIHPGYSRADVNLDGRTIFQGPNNDRTKLLFNVILAHPENLQLVSNFIIQHQF
ncbi:MAG: hypothetical protein AB8G22_00700, partial [Saprospiraceae bacterium]